MNARQIVNHLLETNYNFPDYGEQDKPEHWEGGEPTPSPYPQGFVATRDDGEKFEWKWELGIAGKRSSGYRGIRHWWDQYKGKLTPLSGMFRSIHSLEDAQRFIEQESKKYMDAGWKVEAL